MRDLAAIPVLVSMLLVFGCTGDAPQDEQEPSTAPEPSLLPHPFTADEIRNEWSEGLTLVMERATPEGVARERWTVVASDDDGAEIEYASLDADGNVTGESNVARSTWTELRDHAGFPAAHTTRVETGRETALGMLEGWLYTVRDPETGTVTELFFAHELPGAPVHMKATREGEVVMELSQVERGRTE